MNETTDAPQLLVGMSRTKLNVIFLFATLVLQLLDSAAFNYRSCRGAKAMIGDAHGSAIGLEACEFSHLQQKRSAFAAQAALIWPWP